MSEMLDVFFHQREIPDFLESTIIKEKSIDELSILCENLYHRATGGILTSMELLKLEEQLEHSRKSRHYFEIQLFKTELDGDALLELLQEKFSLFLWTRVSEEIDIDFRVYACEFLPVAVMEGEEPPVSFDLKESLLQMELDTAIPMSKLVEDYLDQAVRKGNNHGDSREEISFPVNVTVEPTVESVNPKRRTKGKERKKVEAYPDTEFGRELSRSEENEIVFLEESLKREKAAKERLRVAKERLELELLAIENNLLVSGLKRFRKRRKITTEEEDWYKSVRIDLIHYDDLYKKAKFIEKSWKLNRELVTITEKMTVTRDEMTYQRERVEKVKHSVSEMDLKAMMEQCHLINDRVRINRGFLFIKPSVKLYRIDYEQLEKISAFFDIIQTENRLLEQIIQEQDT